jgi:O-antigen/teichoic acid export membrane protein
VAKFSAQDEHGKVRGIFLHALKQISLLGFILLALTVLTAPFTAGFLHIERYLPIIAAGILMFAMYLMPVFWGVLQGREQFGFLGMSYFTGFATKCGLAIFLAIIGWGVEGVLFGIALSYGFAFTVAIWPIREVLAPTLDEDDVKMGELYRFALPTIVGLLMMSPYCQLDVFLVRHFFGGSESSLQLAGYYATASIIGKAFYFLPIGIVLALFPRVARKKATGENPIYVLMRGLGLNVFLSMIGIIGCFVLAPYLAVFLAKTDAPELVALIKYFGIAITPVAATMILVNYNLANEQYRFIWPLVPITILTFVGIWFIHSTPLTVLLIMGVGGFTLFLSILTLTILSHRKTHEGPDNGSSPENEDAEADAQTT